MTAPLAFTSAYRSLRPVEKQFVDLYVAQLERDAIQNRERISLALHRIIPADVVDASGGLLDKPLVRAAISERITQLAEQSELTVERVIKELMGVAFASLGDYMEIGEDGQPMFDLTKATPEQLAAIASIEIEETMTRSGPNRKFKFKLHDKLKGIDMLANYMGLLKSDNPFWRADVAAQKPAALPASMSDTDAADSYARLIGG